MYTWQAVAANAIKIIIIIIIIIHCTMKEKEAQTIKKLKCGQRRKALELIG
jgi:hypothetical protein